MFSLLHAFSCAGLGLVLWTGTGYLIARRMPFSRALALSLAPALGWAVQNPLALSLSFLVGFSSAATIGAVALAGLIVLLAPAAEAEPGTSRGVAWWVWLLAAVVAAIPALAVLPKLVPEGVVLATPIFDHSKIALIDAILRTGTPPANPFYGPPEQPAAVAYYYLWHFGAAQLARLVGASGWEADAAASWFTAFATLMLMAGLALHIGRVRLAPVIAIALCCTASLRPVLNAWFGAGLDEVLRPATGFAGWLFQSSWSPHHVAAAGSLVIAAILLVRLARSPSAPVVLMLALVMSAAFQGSVWVGGVVAGLAVVAMLPLLVRATDRAPRFLVVSAAAGLTALALSLPFLLAQYHAALARGGGSPVAIAPFAVLGPLALNSAGPAGNLAAYWLLLLTVEFPLIYLAGGLTLARMAMLSDGCLLRRLDVRALLVLTAASLLSSWLLVSTVGDNNDLGWRAVLPGLLVLTSGAAAGIAAAIERRAWITVGLALAIFAATVPAGLVIVRGNAQGEASPSAPWFARAPAMWKAVRRHARPDERVANNPALFADMTPWPVNISWALLADRPSCFAGRELAIAFAPLSPERRAQVSRQFLAVFAGSGTGDDVRAMAETYDCRVVLLTSLDGAWTSDPFAASPLYRLVETQPGAWRIYVASSSPVPAGASSVPAKDLQKQN